MSNDEMQRDHEKTWNGFTKLMLWSTIGVVLTLALMGLFLVD